VYSICSKYNLIIIEDDPYRNLAFGDPVAPDDAPVPGLDQSQLPASYLSVDTDGRVIRCDTFSKWISPGLRCGWLTAPSAVIRKVAQGTGPSLGVASSVQVLLVAMLERWGDAGLTQHVSKIQRLYRSRCRAVIRAAREHLVPQKLARVQAPQGGMFVWVELVGVDDAEAMLTQMKEAKVAVVPGSYFSHAHASGEVKSAFVRVAFCYANEETLQEGIRRLGGMLQLEQKKNELKG